MSTITEVPAVPAVPHEHISDELWTQLVAALVADADAQSVELDEQRAERAMGELVNVYLPLVFEHSGLSPSKLVDLAWHTFIKHMRAYERYCKEAFDRVIYHEPTPRASGCSRGACADCRDAADGTRYALDVIIEQGLAHCPDLWVVQTGCSNHCHDHPAD